jgi:O-antigen ligase
MNSTVPRLQGRSPSTYARLLLLFFLTVILTGASVVLNPLLPFVLLASLTLAFLFLVRADLVILGVLLFRHCLDMTEMFGRVTIPVQLRSTLNAGIILIVLGAGLLSLLRGRVQVLRIPTVREYVFFLAVVSVSILNAPDLRTSLQESLRLASHLVLFTVAYSIIHTRKHVFQFLAVFLLATVVPNLVGMYSVLSASHGFRYVSIPRMYGATGSGPSHALFLIIPILIAIVLLANAHSSRTRLAWGFILVSLLVPFYYTLARAAWMGLAAGLALMGWLLHRSELRWIVVVILMILLVVTFTAPGMSERFAALRDAAVDPSTQNRLALWKAALQQFRHSPIIGLGFGTIDTVVGLLAHGKEVVTHNDYIRVLADTGIMGLCCFFLLYFQVLRYGIISFRSLEGPIFRGLAAGFLGAWVASMVARMTANVLTVSSIQFEFWAFFALILALPAVEQREKAQERGQPVGRARGLEAR